MISISTEVHALMVTTADSTTLSRALTQFLPYEYCLGGGGGLTHLRALHSQPPCGTSLRFRAFVASLYETSPSPNIYIYICTGIVTLPSLRVHIYIYTCVYVCT